MPTVGSSELRTVPAGARAFFGALIDYAGTFPPASLSLEMALVKYIYYRQDADAWMLGRFVCPASQLSLLLPYADHFDEAAPLTVAALGAKNPTFETFGDALETTLVQRAAFQSAWGARGRADVLELTLPEAVADLPVLLEQTARQVESRSRALALYIELPFTPQWSAQLPRVLDALAAHNAHAAPMLGFKLRTGGVVAGAFPTPAQVAAALSGCRERQLALKCTAGLHHPLPGYEASVGTARHGFVNVFGGGLVSHTYGLTHAELAALLQDADPAHFGFDENGFTWCQRRVTTPDIARLRHTALLAFGCCNFDEPREDIHALHWLD